MIRFLLSSLFTFIYALSWAQLLPLSTAPASLKWNQINTDHFNILFPENFMHEGQRMANTLEHLYGPVSKSLKVQPKPIDILFQNNHAITNGFVALGPRRSEFFTMSPQDYNFLGTNDWLNLLAVHEYRHVVQNEKSIQGFTKLVYWLLGEYGLSGMGFAAVPSWFSEGDAVGMETALSNSGRGRFPSFNMALRAIFLEHGPYNYHKQYLRSFKNFIPNHYVLGYHFTSFLRSNQPSNVWEPILNKAYRTSLLPFNFSNSIKKHQGLHVVDAYKAMTADLILKWNTQLKDLYISKYEGVNVRSSDVFTNYLYPQVSGNGTLVALKSGLSDIETFVELDNSGDQKLFQVGVFNDPGFLSIGNNLLVWTEFEVDPRWGKRSFSVVKTFDLTTRQHSTISTKTRYSGATVSPDDSKIAVINNFSDGRVQIQLISSMGNTLQEFGSPSHTFYSMLRWSADGKFLTALKHRPSEKAIVKIDVENGEEEILMDYSSENRGHPVIHGDYLFYNSPYSGIDNIYAVNLSSRETFQVTSSKYGSFNPVISHDGKMIYYNDFKVNGMDVVKIHFEPLSWTPLHKITPHVIDYYKSTVEQENNGNILNSIPDTTYVVKPYRKSSQLFNIHSWGPYFGTSILNYEIGVIFQDVLSQNAGFAGYDWNVDENTGKWKLEYTYEGFYTAIDIHASTGTRKAVQNLGDTLNIKYDWNETGITTGLRVPLNLTKSKFSTKISFGDHIGYNRVSNFTNTVDDMRYSYSLQANGDLISNSFSFSLTNFLKRPKRNIRSRWGQTLFLDWSSTPFGGDYDAGITSITSQLYFPGFFKHHSINFLGSFQSRKITLNPNNYLFSNNVPYPRGYNSSSWESFRTLRSNYEMTLWNADLAIGPVLNIQRIRLKLFYDTGFGQTDVINSDLNIGVQNTREYQSYGSEIWFDFNFMRLLPLLSGGIRTVYTSESGWRAEIVIGNIQI